MTVAALYVDRSCAGGAIVGLRLFHLRGSSQWRPARTERGATEPLSVVASAADWVAQQLQNAPGPGTLTVVLDAQGSACQWLTSPSADEAAVRATVRDALAAGDDEERSAALSWLADAAPGTDTSVQGLGDVAVLDKPKAAARQRLAMVSVLDLPVRVLLDQLDKRDVVVRRVCSVWHAMATAWDPSAQDRRGKPGVSERDEARVVAASEPVSAVVAIDPDGVLVWSWSQNATLIAGGSMLLRKTVAASADEPVRPALRLVESGGGEAEAEQAEPASVLEVVRSDVGRLANDWLGWSIQLGVAPARIAVMGPQNVTCSGLDFDLPQMAGVAAVGAGLGKHWPGASVQASVQDDAIGSTIARLMDLENGVGPAGAPAAAVDPRMSLTELSGRPGAADRRLHHWAGLALLVAAGAVAVIGWRVDRSVSKVQGQTADLRTRQADAIKSVSGMVPLAATSAEPELVLKSKRIEIEKARLDQKDEEPILAEAARVLGVLSQVSDVRLKTLQVNSLGLLSRIELSVPLEGDQGPRVRELLAEARSGAQREVKWDGRAIRGANAERRDYNMSGQFAAAPTTGAKPATKPSAPPVSPMLDAGPGTELSTSPDEPGDLSVPASEKPVSGRDQPTPEPVPVPADAPTKVPAPTQPAEPQPKGVGQ